MRSRKTLAETLVRDFSMIDPAMIDPSEPIATQRGKDGEQWSFVGTKRGPMIEIVKLKPDGNVMIAPHATTDDLRNAILILASALQDARRIQGVEPADISIDVVI